MDLRDRLDFATRGPSSSGVKVRNITCVMQELGYIDHNLEPNYEKITERISDLPVSSELKGDIQDGLQFCQKFSVRFLYRGFFKSLDVFAFKLDFFVGLFSKFELNIWA